MCKPLRFSGGTSHNLHPFINPNDLWTCATIITGHVNIYMYRPSLAGGQTNLLGLILTCTILPVQHTKSRLQSPIIISWKRIWWCWEHLKAQILSCCNFFRKFMSKVIQYSLCTIPKGIQIGARYIVKQILMSTIFLLTKRTGETIEWTLVTLKGEIDRVTWTGL